MRAARSRHHHGVGLEHAAWMPDAVSAEGVGVLRGRVRGDRPGRATSTRRRSSADPRARIRRSRDPHALERESAVDRSPYRPQRCIEARAFLRPASRFRGLQRLRPLRRGDPDPAVEGLRPAPRSRSARHLGRVHRRRARAARVPEGGAAHGDRRDGARARGARARRALPLFVLGAVAEPACSSGPASGSSGRWRRRSAAARPSPGCSCSPTSASSCRSRGGEPRGAPARAARLRRLVALSCSSRGAPRAPSAA